MDNREKEYLLLTGASSSVGQELAVALSPFYNFVLCGRDEKSLLATKQMLSPDADTKLWIQDLKELSSIEENLANFLAANNILIKKYVHCAGFIKQAPLKLMKCADFEMSLNVNVTSAALIIKKLIERKTNKKNLDSVVFISSSVSNRGVKTFSSYGTSKAALDGLMRNLAVELAPAVRVNSILPGGMVTKMTEEMFHDPEFAKRAKNNYPLGIGTPKDLVPMVKLLLSNDARWITGQQIVIDGGRTIDITE